MSADARITQIIKKHLDRMFSEFDGLDISPDDVEIANEPQICEWYTLWVIKGGALHVE